MHQVDCHWITTLPPTFIQSLRKSCINFNVGVTVLHYVLPADILPGSWVGKYDSNCSQTSWGLILAFLFDLGAPFLAFYQSFCLFFISLSLMLRQYPKLYITLLSLHRNRHLEIIIIIIIISYGISFYDLGWYTVDFFKSLFLATPNNIK